MKVAPKGLGPPRGAKAAPTKIAGTLNQSRKKRDLTSCHKWGHLPRPRGARGDRGWTDEGVRQNDARAMPLCLGTDGARSDLRWCSYFVELVDPLRDDPPRAAPLRALEPLPALRFAEDRAVVFFALGAAPALRPAVDRARVCLALGFFPAAFFAVVFLAFAGRLVRAAPPEAVFLLAVFFAPRGPLSESATSFTAFFTFVAALLTILFALFIAAIVISL
jgi:hypothetical protein